jgi:hypothetical protein
MQAGDYDSATYSASASKAEQSSQPWYPGIQGQYAYVTVQSWIQPSESASALLNRLGCHQVPIDLVSEQQDFTLLAVRDLVLDSSGPATSQSFPLFTFARDDPQHGCAVGKLKVTMGPFLVAGGQIQIDATAKSTISITSNTAGTFGQVTSLVNAIPLNPTQPILGGPIQVGVATAMKGYDAYITANMQKTLSAQTTLLSFDDNDLDNGRLVYTANLFVEKNDTLGASERIEVGTLYLVVKTALSVFTPEYVEVQEQEAPSPGATKTVYLPNYTLYQNLVWNALVKPQTSDVPTPLSSAIDMIPGLAPGDLVSTKLNGLSATSTAADIQKVCSALESRARYLQFDAQDTLAIMATALASTDPWKVGATNMHSDQHRCFKKADIALLGEMGLPAGNESP